MQSGNGSQGNSQQIEYWNGIAGERWTQRQTLQDRTLSPVSDILLEFARVHPGERVLDVGCGCGATSLELASRTGVGGNVLGLDVSERMIARARERAVGVGGLDFIVADATTHAFPPGAATLLFSRFGVMFFAEPPRSFANLRKALAPEGRVAFACWRSPKLNPWLMTAYQEALKHAVKPAEVGPEDPGPFSFASEDRVRRILGEAGFHQVSLTPRDLLLDVAAGEGLESAVQASLEIGPAARMLEEQSPEVRDAAIADIRAAYTPHMRGASVPLGAAIWIVEARTSA